MEDSESLEEKQTFFDFICVCAKSLVTLQRICKTYKKIKYMNTFLKALGTILVLLGVVCMAVYFFGTTQPNLLLAAGLGLEVVGIFTYVFTNKKLS